MKTSTLALGAGLLLVAVLATAVIEVRRPAPLELIPTLTAQPEYCLTCHAELPEISAAHPVQTFGCVICHGGERLALDADLAHSSMRGGPNPSDFAVAQQSCGGADCHDGSSEEGRDHIQRATTSIQSTYAGAITNILYTFGAQPDLTARFGTTAIRDEQVTTSTGVRELAAFDGASFGSPYIEQFAANCLYCHINAPPIEGESYARLTGCAACHSPAGHESDAGETHILTTAIPYTQCNTCHNRGNYDLRSMTFIPRDDHPSDRLHDYYQPIAQFVRCEYTLDCVDCHTRVEAMGDGDLHSNKSEIQYVECKTCHGTISELPQTKTLTDPEDIAFRLAQLNPVVDLQLGDAVLMTEQGEPLWNTRVLSDGTYELVGKATGERFAFRPVMGSGCTQSADKQTSADCHVCHAVER
jgi:hypothetical protein